MGVNQLTLLTTTILSILIFFLPRRYVILPVLAAACYLPLFANLNVAGLNMSMIRIIIFFAWCRFLLRREFLLIDFNKIDITLMIFLFFSILTHSILNGTKEALINRCGMAYDIGGSYFMFRILMRDINDAIFSFKILSVLVFPIALAMYNERLTQSNIFSIFGSPTLLEGYIRGDKIRAFGPFAHPILAGSFGATCSAFFIALWNNKNKYFAIIGLFSSAIIVFTSNSSGPAMTMAAIIIGYITWKFRKHMHIVRRTLLIFIISLHIIMKAPVWFLIAKIGYLLGGTGWHRSELIDSAIRHLGEWWLLGTNRTRHWMPTGVSWSPDHTDITNQFIRIGVDGGLISVLIFIAILVLCFRTLGTTMKNIPEDTDKALKLILWSFGVALFAHIATFFSVRYFDQNILFFYMLISIIAMSGNIIHTVKDSLLRVPN